MLSSSTRRKADEETIIAFLDACADSTTPPSDIDTAIARHMNVSSLSDAGFSDMTSLRARWQARRGQGGGGDRSQRILQMGALGGWPSPVPVPAPEQLDERGFAIRAILGAPFLTDIKEYLQVRVSRWPTSRAVHFANPSPAPARPLSPPYCHQHQQ